MAPDAPSANGRSLRVLIVDDEPLARDCVRLGLAPLDDVVVVGEGATGGEAVDAIRRLAPDVVFLDVQMPGMSGFDVIEAVGVESMPVVVFVTAFEAYALRAFDVHAVDYLLKPFDDARLHDALARARTRVRARREGDLGRQLAALLEAFHSGAALGPAAAPTAPAGRTRIAVRRDDRITFVETDDVDWFEAAGNNVRLHVGSATHIIRSTMRRLMDDLDPDHFVRIHRSTIVNVRRIKEVQPWVGGDYLAILLDGTQLRVSRNYRQRLLGR